jgi:hypothetical protein
VRALLSSRSVDRGTCCDTYRLRFFSSSSNLVTQLWIFTDTMLASVSDSMLAGVVLISPARLQSSGRVRDPDAQSRFVCGAA